MEELGTESFFGGGGVRSKKNIFLENDATKMEWNEFLYCR